MTDIIKKIKKLGIRVEEDVDLSKYTTYKTGGIGKCIAYPDNTSELIKLIKLLDSLGVKHKVLGNGSNLLFSSKGYDGVLINLKRFDKCKFLSNNKVRVGAGFSLIKLSLMCARRGLTGLEFASGIPGSVGGAVYMNAGAYKSDMGYVVREVKVLTDKYEVITLVNNEMNFHYRSSYLQKHKKYICLEAVIKLKKGKREVIEQLIDERRKRRVESQPLEYPSCGSVFRNPTGDFAGRLIEEAGLKGYSIGGAKVSDKHANFIINYDHATGEDIYNLINHVHDTVLDKYNVDLKVEQEFVDWE